MKILMVCTGNICRSPTAEGVLRNVLEKAGLGQKVQIDSAGTHDYHCGEAPDRRAQLHAKRRGYDLSGLRARLVEEGDFAKFDLILAMDRGHLKLLQRASPPEHRHKVKLYLEFAGMPDTDVPDPYYGGPDGFERVLDVSEAASRGLLEYARNYLLRVST
jgi:protein-tyrosine phosphatase